MTYNATQKAEAERRRDEVRTRVEELGSYTAVARELGVTKERVRQIANKGRRVNEPLWRPSWQQPPDERYRERDRVRALVEEKRSFVVAARVLGVQVQRVRQLANRGRKEGEPPWHPRWQAEQEANRPPPGFRRCSRCLLVKPVGEFWADYSRPDDLSLYCKPCASAKYKAWAEANPQRRNALNRKWKAENPEAARAIQRRADRKQQQKRRAVSWSPAQRSDYGK